jgi:hypothetical protein
LWLMKYFPPNISSSGTLNYIIDQLQRYHLIFDIAIKL